MIKCLLPMPASVEGMTKSLNTSPLLFPSYDPIIVHPSLLFLFDPINPHAFTFRVVFFSTAKPSTTYQIFLFINSY